MKRNIFATIERMSEDRRYKKRKRRRNMGLLNQPIAHNICLKLYSEIWNLGFFFIVFCYRNNSGSPIRLSHHWNHGEQCVYSSIIFVCSLILKVFLIIDEFWWLYCYAAATRSFLQVAVTEEATPPLRVVQIEGLVCFSPKKLLHSSSRILHIMYLLCI